MMSASRAAVSRQTVVAIGVLLLAAGMALGAWDIPSAAGYAGVGPNFLPWLTAIALAGCGVLLLREARTGGFRALEVDENAPEGEGQTYWAGLAWMSAALLLNAALITRIGFVLSCTLCFVLAAQGLRRSRSELATGLKPWLQDAVVGLCLAAPVYWMFTKFLAINLPGLTNTGWL
jgi:putative tricarboxylic transport membrane protein